MGSCLQLGIRRAPDEPDSPRLPQFAVLAQCVCFGYRIGELSCPTKYFKEASSINFARSVKYGFEVLGTTLQCW